MIGAPGRGDGWRIGLLVALATLNKAFWEPIRDGSPSPREWPRGLRPVFLLCTGAYVVAFLLTLASGWIRSNDRLVQHDGDAYPVWAVTVLLWLLTLTLALAICGAMHTHPIIGVLTFGACLTSLLSLLAQAAVAGPLPVAATALFIVGLIVFAVVRSRRRYAWFEFPVVLVLVSAAVYVPQAAVPFGTGADLRPVLLLSMLASIVPLVAPALVLAGYAPAEIAVTLSEWLLNRLHVETSGRPGRRVALGVALAIGVLIFGYDVGKGLGGAEWEFRGEAWLGSAVTLTLVLIMCWALLRRRPGQPPSGPTAEVWNGYAFRLVVLWVAVILPVAVLATIGAALTLVAGDAGLAALTSDVASSGQANAWWRLATVVVALVWAVRASRRGQRVAAVLLVCYAALAGLGTLSILTEATVRVSWSLPTLVALAVVLCLGLVVGAMLRRHGVERQLWIALLALVISAAVGRRELLSEPGELAAGVSGLAVLLLGLIWRVLTDAGITRHGSRWFPVSTRVLFYAAYALFAGVVVAFVALTRQEGSLVDLALFAQVGEDVVGTPLILAAILLGALSTMGLRPPRGETPAGTLPPTTRRWPVGPPMTRRR